MKKVFRLPVGWTVVSYMEVEAETEEEAVAILEDPGCQIALPTPDETNYLDGSFYVDKEAYLEDK